MRTAGIAAFAAFAAAAIVAAPALAASDVSERAAADVWTRETLIGDSGGVRPWLADHGLSLALSETSEVLANVSGGIRHGIIYEGLTDAALQFDLRTKYEWPGVFYVRGLQIHGRGLSENYLDNLNTASSIEATRATRLFELWYEHYLTDWLRLKIGQQAADQEFLVSTTAKLFINSTFGFPTLPATDLPSGGPAYPLGTPAARVRVGNDEAHVIAAVFNGDPAGPGPGDPQLRDASGTAFRTGDGAFAIAEIHYNPGATPSNGFYRFGAWYNSERFPSPQFDTNGVPLASPASTGMPRQFTGDYAVYGIIDQPLFREPDSKTGLSVFTRAMGAPGDRNTVDFYLDAGVTYKGPFGRDDDAVGVSFAYARISNAARQSDALQASLAGQMLPVRSSETVVELTYQCQIAPWWQVQPDFQYIVNPGGGIANPDKPPSRIGNAVVLGLRTVITF